MPETEILLIQNRAIAYISPSIEALQLIHIFFTRKVSRLKYVICVFYKCPKYIIVFQSCNIMCLHVPVNVPEDGLSDWFTGLSLMPVI